MATFSITVSFQVFSAMHSDWYSTLMSTSLWDSSQAPGSLEDLHSWHPLCRQATRRTSCLQHDPMELWHRCLPSYFCCLGFQLSCLFPWPLVEQVGVYYTGLRLLSFLLNLKSYKLLLLHACVMCLCVGFVLSLICHVGLAHRRESFWVKAFIGSGYPVKLKGNQVSQES